MTPEEERMIRAKVAAILSPHTGMGGPYVSPESDYLLANSDLTGDEARIEAQRAYARQMRGGELPQGRGVGPSNIYVAPNWGETLGYAAKQLMGGYMEGKANQAERDLDVERQRRSDALARIAATDAREKSRATQFSEGMETARHNRNLDRDMVTDEQWKKSFDFNAGIAEENSDRQFAKLNYERLDESTRQGEREEDIAERERIRQANHEDAMEMERLKAELEENGTGTKLIGDWNAETMSAIDALGTGGERDTARMLLNTAQKLDALEVLGRQGVEDGLEWSSFLVDAGAEAAGNLVGKAARNKVKGAYDERERAIRGAAAEAVESFRRARAGANLTGVEIEVGEDWDPTAPGIGSKESLRRTVELNKAVKAQLANMGISYKPSDGQKPPGMDQARWDRLQELRRKKREGGL